MNETALKLENIRKIVDGDSRIMHPNWIIATATLLVFLPVLSLKFWLIDDHEIVWFLTKLQADGLNGFWYQWSQIPDFGTAPRFRPIYYLFRAAEILLWRDNPFLWITARYAIAVVFAISVYKLARIFYKSLISIFFCFINTRCAMAGRYVVQARPSRNICNPVFRTLDFFTIS